jgi:hypothetical protein
MIGHAAGIPIEEFLLPLLCAGALWTSARALASRVDRRR